MRNRKDLSWSLRRYRDGDEPRIVELLNLAWKPRFGKWHSLEYWEWKYKKNPAGSPIVWLAERRNKIIGHYGIIPVVMKIGNAYMTGSFSGDAATHPKYHGKGIFSSIVNKCYLDAAENDIPLTYGFANVSLGPIYKRYEWTGQICFITSMIKVLDSKRIRTKFAGEQVQPKARNRVAVKTRESKSAPGSLKIERVNRFDQRINQFWEEISRNIPIIVRRDPRYLNWRYAENPEKKYMIYTAEKDDRIMGYCILNETESKNLRLGAIVDILGAEGQLDIVGYLLETAQETFEEHEVDAIFTTISEEHRYTAAFRRAGFVAHPRRRNALYAALNLRGSALDERNAYSQALMLSQSPFLKEKGNWFMMLGDGAF